MTDQAAGRNGHGDEKDRQLEQHRQRPDDSFLTTDQGVRINDTDNSVSAGERGPTIMDDFHFREKITRFDHERIPERVVHARGAGAYGYFELQESLAEVTRADFLQRPGTRTPVFVRFSTVAGSRGSPDTPRDVRGFATKFYTQEGNFDLVGNNMPVFFIQDGIKFPDFVHAVKPEPHNEIPQAASAHNTLWDFVAQQSETMHMMMWLMSDRAIPRSFGMMQGFGVHTFRFVDAQGRGTFVKFHWKPKLGTHSLVWPEAQRVSGNDPDFNRRDLWEIIEAGQYPEWELGVQLVPESQEHSFDFDLLDPTKIIPEEQVPVRPVGRMVLNRNPDNFFAETEQVAFHLGNVVPGIDFTNDPLLQGRLFSYHDTQLIRLGGPNFAQIPINQPVAPIHNDQRDGFHQHIIHRSHTSYAINSISDGRPKMAPAADSGYVHYQERVDGNKIRKRSESFADHFSQATLFWNSMSDWEKRHIVDAYRFELGKVTYPHIREQVVDHLNHIDHDLAVQVAEGLGLTPPATAAVANHGRSSPALSQANASRDSVMNRKVAILAADGVEARDVRGITDALTRQGAICHVIAPQEGTLQSGTGAVDVDLQMLAASSVLYDAVYVPGGTNGVRALADNGVAVHFVSEAFTHNKPVAAHGAGIELLRAARLNGVQLSDNGLVVSQGVVTEMTPAAPSDDFLRAMAGSIAQHRFYERQVAPVPA